MFRRLASYVVNSLIFLSVFAMIAFGFVHQKDHQFLPLDLELYAAMGGQIDGICGTDQGDGHTEHNTCEACRINENILSNLNISLVKAKVLSKSLVFCTIAERIAQRKKLDPARLVRAPPVV